MNQDARFTARIREAIRSGNTAKANQLARKARKIAELDQDGKRGQRGK